MPATALEPTRASVHRPRLRAKLGVLGVLALAGTMVLPAGVSGAATAVGLGMADHIAVLGAGTVTNTGPSVLNGALGVHPGEALVGFTATDGGPGIVNGPIHAGNATAAAAQSDAQTAYNALAAQDCDEDLTGQNLGNRTLTSGVYCFADEAQLTDALTLDAEGDPAAAFIFRIGTALTTASDSSVLFTDDFASCGVFWQVGSAATLGTDTAFVGTVITQTEAITANTRATVVGRLLALEAAVTLDTNTVTVASCIADVVPPGDGPPIFQVPVDETPVDETPVDETPVDEAPVDETPVDETPVDEPTDGTPTDGSTGGPTDGSGGGTPVGPTPTPDRPAVPLSGGPGGPAVPGLTGGPSVPGPRLPDTGSSTTTLGVFGLLTLLVGFGLVSLSEPKRTTARRAGFVPNPR